MIAHLKGNLTVKSPTEIVVDCQGVGYLVAVPVTTSEALPEVGNEVSIATLMVVREDAMELYGFSSNAEKKGFKLLTSIPGIGAKIALGILSSISLPDLQEVILRKDTPALQKLPGVGKKTAERILVELRDKIGTLELPANSGRSVEITTQMEVRDEALSALIALGYSRVIADKAIRQVLSSNAQTTFTVEKLIKFALRNVMK